MILTRPQHHPSLTPAEPFWRYRADTPDRTDRVDRGHDAVALVVPPVADT